MKALSILAIAATVWASSANAQQMSAIDVQLAENMDFRDVKFRACFGVIVCEVDRYRIIAWHRASDAEKWHGAILYWDPVDGLGIQAGGQDDEIDYNERLIVEFPYQQNVYGVWFTDLFINEVAHYSDSSENVANDDAPKSAEIAGIEFRLRGRADENLSVSGNFALPTEPFNTLLAPDLFSESGDLRQRLIINDGTVSILSAARNAAGDRTVLTSVPVDQLDPEKRDLFSGPGSADLDLSALLASGLEFSLEDEGSSNADRINAILNDPSMLEQLQTSARISRVVGDVPNGEVSAIWAEPVAATSIMFHAAAGTSNDFSVAGVIFQRDSQ